MNFNRWYGKKCSNCGETVYESFLKHNTTCQKVWCRTCGSRSPIHDHCQQCKEIVNLVNLAVHQHCQHCSKVITSDDREEHERICPELVRTCEDCKSKIRNCDMITHECKIECELCLIDIDVHHKATHQCDQLVVLQRLSKENAELRENYTELEKGFTRLERKLTKLTKIVRGRPHTAKRFVGGYGSDPHYEYSDCDCIRGYDHGSDNSYSSDEDSE